jgi:Phosphotransferase enzyme family
MKELLGAVAALLPGVHIEPVEMLRRTERSQVLRVRAAGPGYPEPQTLIVKVFADAGEGWARESAALSAAPVGAPMPRLVATSTYAPIVVMADAGTGPSVADALLGDDTAAARTAVGRLAAALAALHLSTRGVRDTFGTELAARSGGTVPESAMPGFVTGAVSALSEFCDQLGVRVPEGALSALAGLPDQLSATGPAALTLADACPDNNVLVGCGYVLIDFEEAEWRHIAWDVAYLTVPWPSCWCSFRLPADVAHDALDRYRSAIADRLPYADTPAFDHDVALATTGWAFLSVSWFLRVALASDRSRDDAVAGLPTRRAVILHRLDNARNATALPVLAEFAARLRRDLVRRWGEMPLETAPAFRPRPASTRCSQGRA